MEEIEQKPSKPSVRKRATAIKDFRCKNLIAVIECPDNFKNIGTVIRNANALGVEKVYVVDPAKLLPNDWKNMRENRGLSGPSVSAVKWTFVKRFDSSEDCFAHLQANHYHSVVTSPHVKGKANVYLDQGDYTKYAKLAVWFGNESRGISALAVDNSVLCVAIPMFGMIESMNLGTSSGIVLYEVTKQRRQYQSEYVFRNRRGKRIEPLPTLIPRDGETAAD